jgi:hypothetical protein
LLRSALRRAARELETRDAVLLSAQLACATLLLAPVGSGLIRAGALALALLGLLLPAAALAAPLWVALAALTALRVLLDWPMSDNHGYLLSIWCVALAVSLAAPRPRAVLAGNARLLIGLAFALATLQKLMAPDYLDGTFFRWALAEDPRFEALGASLGRSGADLERTRAWLDAGPGAPGGAAFVETPALRSAAALLTWATFLFEGAVALAFLSPRALSLSRARDPALAAFCVLTYAIAPVAGFGWLLVSMGVAQCEGPRTRWLYLAAFAAILLHHEIAWLALASGGP